MKKYLSFFLIVSLLIPCFLFLSTYPVSAEGYASPDLLEGSENVFLSYTFSSTPASGHRTKEGYKPLVGYYDTNGNLKDIFFDSFLFLPCVTTTPSGGRTYRDNEHPSNFSDWQLYVDDVFLDGYNIPALNEAVGEVKAQLGSEYADFKANVFLTVLYPVKTQTNFGDVDGDGKTENFNNLADRKKAMKWLVDEQLSRFNSSNFENLNLVGFYWFEEAYAWGDLQETDVITYMTSYVHSLDYKAIWIPYYGATGYNSWRSYGFDVANYQPNYLFNKDATESRLTSACNTAYKYGMGVEVEASGTIFTSVEYYNRYMMYLKTCTELGANKGIKMYYNDAVNGVYYNAYLSKNPTVRMIYDLTYQYASQTLNPNDIKLMDPEGEFKDYYIVSKDASYTTSKLYTDTDCGYGLVSGKELTDGVFGTSGYDTEWIAFNYRNAENGYHYINFDFGSVYNNLSIFSAEFNELLEAGISLPGSVEYLISIDGINYTSLGFAKLYVPSLSNTYGTVELKTPVNARYVRVKIKPGTSSFVFVSEVTIGMRKTDLPLFSLKPEATISIDQNNICKGLAEKKTGDELKSNFTKNMVVKNPNGIVISGSDFVGTGYTVSYECDGITFNVFTVSVLGDISGDGIVSSIDYMLVKRTFLGTYSINSLQKSAADINDDNNITAADYLMIKRHFLGTYNIYN